MENITIKNNSAKIGGGGIYFEKILNENFENKITNSILQNNIATEYGGAIMSTNSNFSFYNTSFQENQAMIGGGIYYSEFKPFGV